MKKLTFLLVILSFNGLSQVNIKEQLQSAEQLINEKKYSESAEYLKAIISENPSSQEAHYYLGQAYYKPLFVDGLKMQNINLKLALKSSSEFKKVIEISPYYSGQVFVLGPYSKIQTIWGSMAMNYILKGITDSAKWAFLYGKSEGGFNDALLEYNKNILAGCDERAIVFTSGDNDTFPIWFLQMIDGYRKDITIINVNLLNVPWYIKQLKNNYPFGYNNISLTISDEKIDELRPVQWQETQMELPVNDPLNKENKIIWTLKPTYENKALLVKDQMILEILKENKWERPVYFSTTVKESYLAGLNEYLTLEGLVRKVNTHKKEISPEKILSNINEVYTYNGLKDEHYKYDNDVKSIYSNYLNLYFILANHFYETGKREEAKEVLSLMLEKFPDDLFRPDLKNELEELNRKLSEQQ
ncbi:MAG: hypothetical protein EHM47_08540 [Ignavibacteriales bacterium]|nr:MAG: hypothetical protein EHM47_08540 [Ignavibacteriales bacterium]